MSGVYDLKMFNKTDYFVTKDDSGRKRRPHDVDIHDECDWEDVDIPDGGPYLNIEHDELHDAGQGNVITPDGYMHKLRAEAIFLNGGRSSVNAKARTQRFYFNEFAASTVNSYKNGKCTKKNCNSNKMLEAGDTIRLEEFNAATTTTKTFISGRVVFLSRGLTPYRRLCKHHKDGGATVWIFQSCDKTYHRCRF